MQTTHDTFSGITNPDFGSDHMPQLDSKIHWVVYKEIYLERLEVRSPDSVHAHHVRAILDRFTRYCNLLPRRLCEINMFHLQEFIARRQRNTYRNQPLENRTLNNEINTLNAAFAYAGPRTASKHGRKNLGLLPSDAVPYLETLDELDHSPVALHPDQLRRLFEATAHAHAPTWPGITPQRFWVAAIVLGLISSLRRSALLKVPRPDRYTLLERRELVLPARLSKTRREQRIALGSVEVAELLDELPTFPGEPILPWKDREGRAMTAAYFNGVFCEMQRRAGISETERIIPKNLRSTAATELLEHFSEGTAKRKLGHSPRTTTLNTNYAARRTSPVDHEASQHLASVYLSSALCTR